MNQSSKSPEPEPRRKLGDRPDFDEWSAEVMGALRNRGRADGQPPTEGAAARLWKRLRGARR